MRRSFLNILFITILFGVCACGNKDANSVNKETNKTNTITGAVYSFANCYFENDIEDGPDGSRITVKVDEKKDGKVIYVTYYSKHSEKKVISDFSFGIGDIIEIEYEGELEEIVEDEEIIEDGEKNYRINNVVNVNLIEAVKD